MKFLTNLDIYGSEIKLRVNNQEKSKTLFGGILTVFTCLSIIFIAWILGQDVVYRNHPISSSDTTITNTGNLITLTKENYPISMFLSDSVGNPVTNTSFFYMKISQYIVKTYYNGTSTVNQTYFPLVKCNSSHFPNVTDASLNSILVQNYCIDNQNFTLKGYWGNDEVRYISLEYFMCNNKTSNNTCATQTEINEYISNSLINGGFETVENSLKSSNFDTPLTQYFANQYKFFYTQSQKITNYFVSRTILNTDTGFFTESKTNQEFLLISELQSDILTRTANRLLTMNIYANKQSVIYYRSYIKITQIFGSLGGILNFIVICFTYINLPFSKIEKYIAISQEMSNFCNYRNGMIINAPLTTNFLNNNIVKIKLSDNLTTTTKELHNNNDNFNFQNLNNQLNKDSSNQNKQDLYTSPLEINNKHSEVLKNNFTEKNVQTIIDSNHLINRSNYKDIALQKIKYWLCCGKNYKSRQFRYFLKEENKIRNLFDIGYIFKNIIQIEYFKRILLKNESNLKVFNTIFEKTNQNTKFCLESFTKKQNKDEIEQAIFKLL